MAVWMEMTGRAAFCWDAEWGQHSGRPEGPPAELTTWYQEGPGGGHANTGMGTRRHPGKGFVGFGLGRGQTGV